MAGKLMSMREAVDAFIPDGASVAIGLALESAIPFAAGHEIIRRQRRRLTLIGPISDMLFDQMIGANCVAGVIAAWVGNVSAGLGHNYRRATECRAGETAKLAVEDHSNFSIALALRAGAMGVPFIPTRSLLGTDLLLSNRNFRVIDDEGTALVRVPAVVPDVTIIHAQRADDQGNAHLWGSLGVSEEAALAARRVIVSAEQIVPAAVIRSDPNRVLTPAFKVCAVVHAPGGAHPSPVQGHYNRDHAMYQEYHVASRDTRGYARWLDQWVLHVPDREAYLAELGAERWSALQAKKVRNAAAVNYGY